MTTRAPRSEIQVAITVLTAPGCPHCARAVGVARALAAARPMVTVTVRDVAEEPALLARLGVKSVPVVVVDDVVLCGDDASARLGAVVAAAGTPAFAGERLRALIAGRRLDEAVACLGRSEGLGAVAELLRSGELSLRVALRLALEEAAVRVPGCLRELVPELLPLVAGADARLRGDVADVLGLTGDGRARAALTALRDDPDADVAEAARDALARL